MQQQQARQYAERQLPPTPPPISVPPPLVNSTPANGTNAHSNEQQRMHGSMYSNASSQNNQMSSSASSLSDGNRSSHTTSPPLFRPIQPASRSAPLQEQVLTKLDSLSIHTPPPTTVTPSVTASVLSYEKTLELYRLNAKKSNDPNVQMEFARYLIQIAESIQQQGAAMDKQARKARTALMNEGVKWIKRLASTGLGVGKPAYPDAQMYLAECYGNGMLGLSINHDKAFSLYVQASKQNHPAATYRAAVCYEIGVGPRKDYARAVQFYRKASALGDIGAMYKFAMIMLNGTMNTQKNEREGVTWLKRAAAAADETHPEALYELANVYEKGGIPSVIADEAYARELYTKAAQLGFSPAQFKLGFCFEYGSLTCEVDPRRSIAWYTRSAEQGHPEAELALSGWYLTGSEGILQQSDTEAYLWARKSAEQAFPKAEYAVGYYSEVGIGVVKSNIEEAIRWYTKAASQGNLRAKQRLTEIKNYNKMQGKLQTDSLHISQSSDCSLM